MAVLLIDSHHQFAAERVLPPAWLRGFDLSVYEPGHPDRIISGSATLADASGLIVRSVTKVTRELLSTAPNLRAVATCSSGFDHLDIAELAERAIPWFHGRGGNAIAVAEWVLWALSRQWSQNVAQPKSFEGRRVIVVGCGAVGSCVIAALRYCGAEVVCVDPPRARVDADFEAITLDDALSSPCDALTLHVPRIFTGPDATVGMIGPSQLKRLEGSALINAARGGVIDEHTAAQARLNGHLSGLWLDTFEHEPHVDSNTLRACDGATPHIAGHSIEGKLKVALGPVNSLRELFGRRPIDRWVAPKLSSLDPARALDRLSAALRTGAAFLPLRSQHTRHEGHWIEPEVFSQPLAALGCRPLDVQ